MVKKFIDCVYIGNMEKEDKGGTLIIFNNRLQVMGPEHRLPKEIIVDISDLKRGDQITVRDLGLPPGVKSLRSESVVLASCTNRLSPVERLPPGVNII